MCNYKYKIGIDVSKSTLDGTVLMNRKAVKTFKITNNRKSIISLLATLKKQAIHPQETLFCFENTGVYSHVLAHTLHEKGAVVWTESPISIKRSMGLVRGKSDIVDSYRIALYAERFQERIHVWQPKRKALKKLETLFKARKATIKTMNQLKLHSQESRGQTQDKTIIQAALTLRPLIKAHQTTIKKIEKEIASVIAQDEKLSEQIGIITSIKGIGLQVGIALVTATNEFSEKNQARKLACHAGVAPFDYQSGTSIKGRSRVSSQADKPLKTLLHLAALAHTKGKSELKKYYERKVTEGKPKMLVLNAIRNKLLARVCSCINRGEKYQENYTRKVA